MLAADKREEMNPQKGPEGAVEEQNGPDDTSKDAGDREKSVCEASDSEYDSPYSPILPEVDIPTNEEEEEIILSVRARIYRFDTHSEIREWKERGTGQLKMLKHHGNKTVRIVMRRDRTLKVCANHFITPLIELIPKLGSDRVFVYKVFGEFSNEEIRSECLAVKFGTVAIANQFKNAFMAAQDYVRKECVLYKDESDDEISEEDDKENEKIEDVKKVGDDEGTKKMTEQLKDLNVSATD